MPLTDELIKALPKELYADLIEILENVAIVNWLVQPKEIRGTIQDRPFMEEGDRVDWENKRKIDITRPHILEDMDYFRERALFFEKHGRYTNIPPNGNPKSEYAAFWKEEKRRWKDGYAREDGEWIPGYLYFYWNYSPIWLVLTESKELTYEQWVQKICTLDVKKKKKGKGSRNRKFPKPWLGDYLYYHYIDQARESGQHGKLLKTRGVGFSFKMGSISPCNMYTLTGSGNPNFHLASEKTFLEGDKGIWGKVLDCLDWIAEATPMPRMRLTDSKKMEVQLGYKDEYGIRKGILSSVFGISLKDNPDKARGIRGPLIHYEEDGLFPNLEKAWGVNRKAVEDGDVGSGFMLAGGTGGTEGASFEGSEKLFYSPGAYNIYSVPNVYDKNTNDSMTCGFFWGAYMNRNGCYDDVNGEPDVIKALLEILANRRQVKYGSQDPNAIIQVMAEEPIVPQEAVMRTTGTIFPVMDLKDYLSEIMPNFAKFVAPHWVGRLSLSGDREVQWVNDANVYPQRDFPIKDNKNKEGAIEIFEMPYKDSSGKTPHGLYIAGIDPIDDDESGTNSLFSMLVLNTVTDRIVAEFTGRTFSAEDCYETARRLLMFYNGQALYENDKKGLYAYFRNKNSLHLLADTPEIVRDMDMGTISKIGNKSKGVNSSKKLNAWGRRLQASYLVETATSEMEYDEEGNEIEKEVLLNLHKIRSVGYVKELIAWHPDINADRVSAAGVLMILRADREQREVKFEVRNEGLNTDEFWSRNFGEENNVLPDLSKYDNL
jgi:hypothetical protein